MSRYARDTSDIPTVEGAVTAERGTRSPQIHPRDTPDTSPGDDGANRRSIGAHKDCFMAVRVQPERNAPVSCQRLDSREERRLDGEARGMYDPRTAAFGRYTVAERHSFDAWGYVRTQAS